MAEYIETLKTLCAGMTQAEVEEQIAASTNAADIPDIPAFAAGIVELCAAG